MSVAKEMCDAWRSGVSMDDVLSRFVIETGSRAAGCWRLEDGHLALIGFGHEPSVSDEVSQGFQDATRLVSLERTGLGIVKAVVSNQPTIALRDPATTGLPNSASWIVRFDANASLATPIRKGMTIVGALAVSTVPLIEPGDELWKTITSLADELGSAI